MDTLEMQVERATKLSHENTVLQSKVRSLEQRLVELGARYTTLQEQHWKLQDRHVMVQETLLKKLY